MNGHELLDKLDLVDPKYVTEAERIPRHRQGLRRWGGIAAVFCLVAALALILPRLGGNAPQSPGEGGFCAGHNAEDGSTEFMLYEGPVLPLTTLEKTDLTATRHLTMDFGIYGSEEKHYSNYLQVRDSYVLTNPTDGEIIATVSYPVIGSFRDLPKTTITVDGTPVETELVSGMYSGSFRGAGDPNTTSMNLDYFHSWEDYRALLQDGAYMAEAWSDDPTLDTTVTVYEITDITHNAPADATNPTLNFTFDLPKETILLSYGFNGGSHDPDGGHNERQCHIPKDFHPDYGQPKYLIFLGKDISGYTMQGYLSGLCEPYQMLDVKANVRRYETTLGDILDTCAALHYDQCQGQYADYDYNRYLADGVTREIYYEQVRRYFARYGTAGTEAKERYQFGMLEDIISETVTHERVMYHTFPITVGAGKSVMVNVATTKPPSYDFDCCTNTPNAGIDGYDMMTVLGSSLTFTGQSAAIKGYDHIEIARQNFGFDLASGVTEVDLDMTQEHYYIEVRKIKTGA